MVTHSRRTSRPKAFGRGTRTAVALIAMGAFLLSSGLVIVTQGDASAASHPKPAPGNNGNGNNGNGNNGNGNNGNGNNPHKSYVCKYVGKPGVDERLQGGGNPIFVDDSSIIKDGGAVAVGSTFSDAHTHSVVILADPPAGTPAPTVADCPAPVGPPPVLGLATGSISVTQANCTTPTASFTASGTNATFAPPTASGIVPDTVNTSTVSTQGTATNGFAFSDGSTKKTFTGTVQPFNPANCKAGLILTSAAVAFTDPTCAAGPSYTTTPAAGVTYSIASGSVAAGSPIRIKAAADATHAFDAAGTQVEYFDYRFPTPNCPGGNPGGGGGNPGGGGGNPGGGGGNPGGGGGNPGGGGGGVTLPPTAVATKAPSFTDATCSAPNAVALKLPGTAGTAAGGALATSVLNGVTYTATGTLKPGHTIVVTAVPGASQVLTAGSVTQWKHTFAKASHCGTKHQPSTHHGHHAHHGQKAEHAVHHAPEAAVAPSSVVVPTNVDAGLIDRAGPVATPSLLTQLRTLGMVLVLAGGLLLLGGGSWLGLGRRRRGALV